MDYIHLLAQGPHHLRVTPEFFRISRDRRRVFRPVYRETTPGRAASSLHSARYRTPTEPLEPRYEFRRRGPDGQTEDPATPNELLDRTRSNRKSSLKSACTVARAHTHTVKSSPLQGACAGTVDVHARHPRASSG
ncbi:uncharacterized protein LOC143180151 [Calliopsis andreniformis]|uniref:uncharacterized protein LOC143180151 n=1 Tax=Calliopsis andreniformis TaxID=337506 RepID=UPI003FCD045A